jgi:hypothetical protein
MIELVMMLPDPVLQKQYPFLVLSEGMSPSQFGILPGDESKEKIVDILEMFDIGADDDDDALGEEDDELSEGDEEGDTLNDDLV